jgi:hypothetical protein
MNVVLFLLDLLHNASAFTPVDEEYATGTRGTSASAIHHH